ncbi:hypothetical protein V6N11_061692 [Hibiscus sabdariffa]|uniref:Uncharacterized protein n=1 Tax=Hibiscus sabdariffa TaxID=183260 RepID=A0ABR2NUS7_9ROSI
MDFDVWVPVHACSRDTFEQLVSYWGLVIVLEEATAKPSSFERGWVLVESSVLDRIEERLELLVDGHVFPIRLTESDTLLRGPRVYGSSDSRSSSDEVVGLEVMVPDEANATAVVSKDLLIVNSDEAEVEGVRWRGNELWNGQEEALNAIVQTGDSEQLVDVVGVCVGPGFEGSNADVKMSNNNSRKVRLLSDVISSLQTPEEKRKAIKKGRGRPRKAIVSNVKIADISLSDSNLGHVQLMESEWCRIGEEASMPVTILEKLRQLKSFLKVWNRESFRSVDLQIEVTTDLLNDLDERVGAWKRFRKLSDNYKADFGWDLASK